MLKNVTICGYNVREINLVLAEDNTPLYSVGDLMMPMGFTRYSAASRVRSIPELTHTKIKLPSTAQAIHVVTPEGVLALAETGKCRTNFVSEFRSYCQKEGIPLPDPEVTPDGPAVFNGIEITFEDDVLVSLTDMWKADGSRQAKKPVHFLKTDGTVEFIEQIREEIKGKESYLLRSIPGRGGGTYAHWKIAVQYAAFLSPKFASWMADLVRVRFIEINDPEQGAKLYRERAITDRMNKTGCSREQAIHYFEKSLVARKTVSSQICRFVPNARKHIAEITDHLNMGFIGMRAQDIKKTRGVSQTRESFTLAEQMGVAFLEQCMIDHIDQVRYEADPYHLRDMAYSNGQKCRAMMVR